MTISITIEGRFIFYYSIRGMSRVREGIGSIFRRKDGKFFVYLPQGVTEDTAFPFEIQSSTKVKVRFTEGGKIIIEPVDE